MLEAIAILLLQAGGPNVVAHAPRPLTPMSDQALAAERSGPIAGAPTSAASAPARMTSSEWAARFDSSVMPVRLTTQIIETMMQPDRGDLGFYSGFLLTPGTTISVAATINGRDFQLR